MIARELEEIIPPQYRAYAWQETNGVFYQALIAERNVMFIILTLIICVAAFNIISGQIMLVREKTANIAIMMGMGAKPSSIMRIFLITGSATGILGAVLGAIGGTLFALYIENIRIFIQKIIGGELFSPEIYYLAKLPSDIQTTQIAIILLMAISLTLLASLYPAFRATRIDPAEILRYEHG